MSSTAESSPRRGPWSPAEDQKLLQLIESHGPSNWVRISNLLATRTPKQCRERYHQNLKPSLNHGPITEEEGLLIEQLVAQYGKKWAEIARHLKGRSDNAVKNWWNGGANRRRRASVQVNTHELAAAGPHGVPALAGPGGPPPPPPPAQLGDHPAWPPGPPPPGAAGVHPPPPAHRLSMPNIYSGVDTSSFGPGRIPPGAGGKPPPLGGPQQQPQQQPSVIFNSAYTTDSSGFRKSSTSSVFNAVDPHAKTNTPTRGPLGSGPVAPPGPGGPPPPNGHGRSSSIHHPGPFTRTRRHFGDDVYAGTPYSRRLSANTISTTGYSSSRHSSIGGVSSASDNDEPLAPGALHSSLSKYSLSNSASNSRRNSHVVPQPPLPPLSSQLDPSLTPLPPLASSSGIGPAIASAFGGGGPGQYEHRHSISGYPSHHTPPGPSQQQIQSSPAQQQQQQHPPHQPSTLSQPAFQPTREQGQQGQQDQRQQAPTEEEQQQRQQQEHIQDNENEKRQTSSANENAADGDNAQDKKNLKISDLLS